MSKKFPIGSNWLYKTNQPGVYFDCEVIAPDDPRLKKYAMPDDICIYFTQINWANTYDEEVAEQMLLKDKE